MIVLRGIRWLGVLVGTLALIVAMLALGTLGATAVYTVFDWPGIVVWVGLFVWIAIQAARA